MSTDDKPDKPEPRYTPGQGVLLILGLAGGLMLLCFGFLAGLAALGVALR